jgi:hypothetical protein
MINLGSRQADVLRCLLGNANGAWSGGRSGFVYGDRFTTFTILQSLAKRGLVAADYDTADDYGVFTITREGRKAIKPRLYDRLNVGGWMGTMMGDGEKVVNAKSQGDAFLLQPTMSVVWDDRSFSFDYAVADYVFFHGFVEGRASYNQIKSAEKALDKEEA